MSRRSVRLLASGYYTPDGGRVISYKEHPQKIFKSHHKLHLHQDAEATSWDQQPGPLNSSDHQPQPPTKSKTTPHILVLLLAFLLGVGIACMTYAYKSSCTKHEVQRLQKNLHQLKEVINIYFPVADRMPNFALESLGAKVVSHTDTYINGHSYMRWIGIPLNWWSDKEPTVVLQGRTQLVPGQCWCFPGDKGELTIRLSHATIITHVTVGHILMWTSPTNDITSAPKRFSVYGMQNEDDKERWLGTFVYSRQGDPIQMFSVHNHEQSTFTFIRVKVESNWGNPDYSCLYSLRVHGRYLK